MHHTQTTQQRSRALLALCTGGALTASLLSGIATAAPVVSSSAADRFEITGEAAVYSVVQEGLTVEDAKGLGDRAGIPAALRKDGSFAYVDAKRSGVVPSARVALPKGKRVDEDGNKIVAQAVDLEALKAIEVLDDKRALTLARRLLPELGAYEVAPRVEHTQVDLADRRGRTTDTFALDTSVAMDLSLRGVPVVGPGARSRVAFGSDGEVIALTQSVRQLEIDRFVGIISAEAAAEECARVYGPKTKLATPTLVYYAPALTGQGEGTIKQMVPQYSCTPAAQAEDELGLTGLLIPAAPELTPVVSLDAARDGRSVKAGISIEGGAEPYSVQWTSGNNPAVKSRSLDVAYAVSTRAGKAAETLTATVTDANGIVSTASVKLGAKGGEASSTGFGGGGGALASYGIASPIDEWSCAQNSSNGFRNKMNSTGQSRIFDWRGNSAWESDFKRTSNGGHDDNYADKADIAYYTGHGSAGGFTFKNTTQDDSTVTPNDARWGDNFNLEWMNLESCEVLRDTNGSNDYFGRWAPAFDGLHVLNGFDTLAQCNSSTGGRFAEYLFPRTFLFWTSPALSVTQAWSETANDLQPGGRRWRSISPMGAGGVHNLNDRFWGQGGVGPDIRANQRTGFIAISGTT